MCIVSTLEAAIANGRANTVRSYANAYVESAKRASAACKLQLNMCEVSRLAFASIPPRSGRICNFDWNCITVLVLLSTVLHMDMCGRERPSQCLA